MRKVDVYCNDVKAGELTELTPGRGYRFAYDETYLGGGGGAVSVTLPKGQREYEAKTLFPFFSNMLPEGRYRSAICRHYKIDEEDLFGLLYIMAGADFIGAVDVRNARNE